MSDWVLDASALIALVDNEPGAEHVRAAVDEEAAISAVNLAEVVSKYIEAGFTETDVARALSRFPLQVAGFDEQSAWAVGLLRATTRGLGLSLGDRACLALAQRLGAVALTTDRAWQRLGPDFRVLVIR